MEGQQTQADSKAVQSSITEQEEQKISDQLSELNLQEEDSGPQRPYILMHSTESWPSIVEALTSIAEKKATLDEIPFYISSFMKQYEPSEEMGIDLLQEFFKSLGKKEQQEWEKEIFPYIAKLVLKSPELFPNGSKLILLGQNDRRKQILTKEQCASLLAQMFMCTILDQKNKKLPRTFNFSEVFTAGKSRQAVKLEKIKCMGQYFKQVKRDTEARSIQFERIVHKDSLHGGLKLKDWKESAVSLGCINLKTAGKIEDAAGAIEVDFANKFLGGGVLRTGAAQEEIQFMTSPEHLVGLLFCEVLEDHEAIKIRGCKTFCDSKGYLDHWKFGGGIVDKRPMTEEGILDREVLAIDALNFRLPKTIPQFSEEAVLREVNKAYIGFYGSVGIDKRGENKIISTGKWGCGAFQGDTQLKFILQWLASSRAGRELVFYSFGDVKNLKHAEKVIDHYKAKTVGELVEDVWKSLEKMRDSDKQNPELFSYLLAGKGPN